MLVSDNGAVAGSFQLHCNFCGLCVQFLTKTTFCGISFPLCRNLHWQTASFPPPCVGSHGGKEASYSFLITTLGSRAPSRLLNESNRQNGCLVAAALWREPGVVTTLCAFRTFFKIGVSQFPHCKPECISHCHGVACRSLCPCWWLGQFSCLTAFCF